MNKGRWNGQTIISEDWINLSIAQISEKFNHYGFYWWTLPGFENYDQYGIPDSTYFAVGANGQRMCIVPEKDLIVLRMADDRNAEENTWDTLKFLSLILESIIE